MKTYKFECTSDDIINGTEVIIRYELCPAEPDVGIFSEYVDDVTVSVKSVNEVDLTQALSHATMDLVFDVASDHANEMRFDGMDDEDYRY